MQSQQEIIKENKLGFIEHLAEKLGIAANARHIYAKPIERDGVTIVPVAKAAYGLGGGSGGKGNGGGGGGVSLSPVGYIEIKNGETRFRPTLDWTTLLPIIAVSAPVVLASFWGVKKILKKIQGK